MGIPKLLLYGEEGRAAIKRGLDTLANAVKVTLGPKGRNVIFENKFLAPTITKDGVTVAREIELENRFENMGCELGKGVAARTVETAGDGTTTAVVLAQAIYDEGLKVLTSGINPILLKRGMDVAVVKVIEYLKNHTVSVSKDEKRILDVAIIASNNDTKIGSLIAEAVKKVGEDGVITIEDSPTPETFLEIMEGMRLTEGLVSPYFINKKHMEASYKKPLILCASKELRDAEEIIPIFEKAIKANKPLVVIAEGVSGTALSTFIANKVEGGRKIMCIKAPGYGDRRRELLEDIAIYTGTQVISDEFGNLKDLEVEDLGGCESITAGKEYAVILKGSGTKENINARIEEIKLEIDVSESDYDKEKLSERLAKLSTGVAVLKVGAPTEPEMREKKMRVEDALHATRAAIDEGIIAGGGIALFRASLHMPEPPDNLSDDEKAGYRLIIRALDKPLRIIVENAGLEGADVISKLRNKPDEYGLDVLTMKYGNLIKSGVIDPIKVVRLTVENAASLSGMAFTGECLITEKPEEKEPYKPQRER